MLGSQLLLPSMDGGPRGPAEAVGMGLAYYELFKSLLRHLDTFGLEAHCANILEIQNDQPVGDTP